MMDIKSPLQKIQQAYTPIASDFYPPDQEPNYTKYACSYHWFRGSDGRAISLDVIRSDDTGNLGLRVVRERADGELDGISRITPTATWAPMRFDGVLDEQSHAQPPFLSRCSHAIAGRATDAGASHVRGIHSVSFALRIKTLESGYGTGQIGLGISHVVATDFPRVHYQGFVNINGEHIEVDSPGSISLHSGDALPQYGYLITLPHVDDPTTPKLLVAAVYSDTLRIGKELVGPRSFVYGYGVPGVPIVSVHLGDFGRDIPLGLAGHLELADIKPFVHDFLGMPTCTASVKARFVPTLGAPIELGRAFIDYRGQHFLNFLDLPAAQR